MPPKQQATIVGVEGEDAAGKRKAEDEGETPAAKATKVEEEPEKEEDAKEDKRKRISREVLVEMKDATPNVIPTAGGVLMALSDSGLSYLTAGARANTGVKAGRYFFEARIFEILTITDRGQRGAQVPNRQQMRIGFSTSSSCLLLGEDDEGVCFDAEGFFTSEKKRRPAGTVPPRFGRDQVVGVLLNLEKGHPNENTVSLFKEGKRVSAPFELPEATKGKVLHPHVSFRNMTVHLHFGPQPMFQLPFKCRMIQDASEADAVLLPEEKLGPKTHEVLFPIALPDEGAFDWLDAFLQKHPEYVELSDRRIVDWATQSGIGRPQTSQWKHSNDKPDVKFNAPGIDDMSARKVIHNVAPLVPRNYVVMEVKSNLVKSERKEMLARFKLPHFKKVARVMIGSPPPDFVKATHERILQEKQEKLAQEWQAKKGEAQRKRAYEQKARELEQKRKQAEEEKKKQDEEAKAAEDAEGEGAEAKDEVKEEGKADVKEEAKDEAKEDVPMEEEEWEKTPPKAELTDDDKAVKFRPNAVPDILATTLGSAFGSFSLPSKQDEDFDEIVFEWDSEPKAAEYMRSWILERKRTTRVEDLQPSEWFNNKLAEWQKLFAEWQSKQKTWKQEPLQKEKARRKAEKEMRKAMREQKKKLQAEKEAADKERAEKGEAEGEQKEGDEKPEGAEEKKDEAPEGEKKEEEEEEEEDDEPEPEEKPPPEVDSVQDILDMRDGEPLFSNFQFEDWALVGLRFESYLLVKAFKRDVNDPDRPGMHESHLPFYYQKYFRKQLNLKFFGVSTLGELFGMVKDTAGFNSESILQTPVPDEAGEELAKLETFVKMAEVDRRDRATKVAAGDESAKLKFSVLAASMGGSQQAVMPGEMARPPPAVTTVPPPTSKKGGPYSGGWQSGQGGWGKGGGGGGGGKGGYSKGGGYNKGGKGWGKW